MGIGEKKGYGISQTGGGKKLKANGTSGGANPFRNWGGKRKPSPREKKKERQRQKRRGGGTGLRRTATEKALRAGGEKNRDTQTASFEKGPKDRKGKTLKEKEWTGPS